ncbi:MAG: endonuclease III [Calditrichaeota bacterium]|nr:endonuclease III [Calditrichota bacterium]
MEDIPFLGKPDAVVNYWVVPETDSEPEKGDSHAIEVLDRLKKVYPDATCTLDFKTPVQLLVATILSAQCTDERVNKVTPKLFRNYPTARDLAEVPIEKLEEIIRSTGFYHQKARSIQESCKIIVGKHGGEVPDSLEALVRLPGVGRKTANVVLGNAFGKNVGVVVDTHVGRLSRRLGLTGEKNPEKIEKILMQKIPRSDWTLFSHLLIEHGRKVCTSRAPKCEECFLKDLCVEYGNR